MKCPDCGGDVKVMDSVFNTDQNEVLRKRKCKDCGHVFYTIEFEIEYDTNTKETWNRYCRWSRSNRTTKADKE